MKEINVPTSVFLDSVKNHEEVKPKIIEFIKDMGSFSYRADGNNITNTDWHLPSTFPRKYYDSIKPIMETHLLDLNKIINYETLHIINYWFQQYHTGDYHEWHNHGNSMLSSVYYLNLPDGCPKTTFKFGSQEFEVDIKEGDILTFPSYFVHQSPPNMKEEIKTVIAFNIGGAY